MEDRYARRITVLVISLSLVLIVGMLLPGSGYSQFQPGQKRTVKDGEKLKIKGAILNRDGELFVVRDVTRTDIKGNYKVKTDKKGHYFHAGLPLGQYNVILEVEGKGAGGRLVADEIEFTEADLKSAITAYAQTAPLKQKLSDTEQKLADTSKEVVDTNKRIDEIDQYELVKVVTVPFAANSATLTDNAKAQLDEIASNAPNAKNYLIEVKGYTDVTGEASKNLDLSLSRADAVMQYLAVKNIPPRRMTIPMGYGESKSGATTPAGREAENRVDVRILVNKGLSK